MENKDLMHAMKLLEDESMKLKKQMKETSEGPIIPTSKPAEIVNDLHNKITTMRRKNIDSLIERINLRIQVIKLKLARNQLNSAS